MTNTYLVQCECGAKTAVEVTQAGQSIACPCGRTVEVPTMRGLRQLEQVDSDATAAGPAWSGLQGALFVLGAVILLGSVTLVVLLQLNRPAIATTVLTPYDSTADEYLANMTAEQTLDVWQGMMNVPLTRNLNAPHLVNRRRLVQIDRYSKVALGGAIVGLVILGASFLCKTVSNPMTCAHRARM